VWRDGSVPDGKIAGISTVFGTAFDPNWGRNLSTML
jgi:hypothetical protein